MNERIRELAEYAWEYTTEQTDGWINQSGEVNWDFLHEYDKKFAEMIVRECIAKCDDLNSMKYIADHFGIKLKGLNHE